jgi:hypothetical protein
MLIRSRGAKRLAAVFSALGCCAGLYLSWLTLSDYWVSKAEAKDFGRLRDKDELLSLLRPVPASPWRVAGDLDCYNSHSKQVRILVKDILDEQVVFTASLN